MAHLTVAVSLLALAVGLQETLTSGVLHTRDFPSGGYTQNDCRNNLRVLWCDGTLCPELRRTLMHPPVLQLMTSRRI
jgi:hypothetical protein